MREFRDEAGELQVGEDVKVDVFEKGQTVKVSGVSKGKGFQGTIKRHNFTRGPVTPRLAQRARAGLDRRVGHAVARLQGHPRPGPDGQQARHAARPRPSSTSIPDENLLLLRGSVPGAEGHRRRDQDGELMAAKAATLGKTTKTDVDETVFGEKFHMSLVHEAARAELNARRQGTAVDARPAARSR